MSHEQTRRVAQQLLDAMGKGAAPDEIAALFSADVQFEIAGEAGLLPWLGRRNGRAAVADFIRDTRRLIERVRFDVHEILRANVAPSSSANSHRGSTPPERCSLLPSRSSSRCRTAKSPASTCLRTASGFRSPPGRECSLRACYCD